MSKRYILQFSSDDVETTKIRKLGTIVEFTPKDLTQAINATNAQVVKGQASLEMKQAEMDKLHDIAPVAIDAVLALSEVDRNVVLSYGFLAKERYEIEQEIVRLNASVAELQKDQDELNKHFNVTA